MQQELFNGRPFDKQFACKYIQPNVPDHGVIGKVFIEKKNDDGTVEPLFDFLLTKVCWELKMIFVKSNLVFAVCRLGYIYIYMFVECILSFSNSLGLVRRCRRPQVFVPKGARIMMNHGKDN